MCPMEKVPIGSKFVLDLPLTQRQYTVGHAILIGVSRRRTSSRRDSMPLTISSLLILSMSDFAASITTIQGEGV